MNISAVNRNRLLAAALLSFVFLASAPRAHAVSKEIVELQTQVQQLLDQVQRLQSTLDTKMGVLQHLAEQTADEANQMTTAVTALQQKLNTQNEAANGKLDSISGQVQSMNDSVDELKARIAKLDKSVADLQTQIQNMQAPATQPQPGAMQPGAGGTPGAAPTGGPAPGAGAQQAPPLQETLQAGVRDYNAGRYDVALGEFQSVVQFYPLDDLAGTAQFYLGEIAYQQKDYPSAITAYNQVLEAFSGNAKAPAAQLHKGYALLAEDKHEEGIHELRSLIQRHPQTPEARAARSKLTALGVKPTAAGH
ncbi:MAG: tetratricopeptide repeat protein [Terracidiphilus sp.]|jgi:tol-pal system protein YbgF